MIIAASVFEPLERRSTPTLFSSGSIKLCAGSDYTTKEFAIHSEYIASMLARTCPSARRENMDF
jgi:hypothetical protein